MFSSSAEQRRWQLLCILVVVVARFASMSSVSTDGSLLYGELLKLAGDHLALGKFQVR